MYFLFLNDLRFSGAKIVQTEFRSKVTFDYALAQSILAAFFYNNSPEKTMGKRKENQRRK